MAMPSPVATANDKTDLLAAIQIANTLYSASAEGTLLGQFDPSAKASFNTIINEAAAINASSTSTLVDVTNALSAIQNATSTFKNAMTVSVNPLADGLYYISISDGTTDIYLNDVFPRTPGNSSPTNFTAKIGTDSLSYQQFTLTLDASVSRYKIESKYRLDNPSMYPFACLNENCTFGSSYYNTWNTMKISFDGTYYAIQKGGDAGKGYWYPSRYAEGASVNNQTTNGASISESLVFKFTPVLVSSAPVVKDLNSTHQVFASEGMIRILGSSVANVTVYDFTGKSIKNLNNIISQNIAVPNGQYIVKVVSANTSKVTKVIVK